MARRPSVKAVFKEHNLTTNNVRDVLGTSRQAVEFWISGVRLISVRNAVRCEELLGVPKWKMRPDIWTPPEPERPAKAAPAKAAAKPTQAKPASAKPASAKPAPRARKPIGSGPVATPPGGRVRSRSSPSTTAG